MLLNTMVHTNVLGMAGTGKSEAILKIYSDFVNEVLMCTPTGILAAKVCGNTYFTNLGVKARYKMKDNTNLAEGTKRDMRLKYLAKQLVVIDEIYQVGQYKLSVILNRITELFQYQNKQLSSTSLPVSK
jgi:hypothetical protein